MSYDPDRHHRRSIRLADYDYRQAGAYFVTICTHERRPLFGTVVRGRVRLSPCGRVAAEEWRRTAELRDNVELDAFVVMPNHLHGLLILTDDVRQDRRGTARRAPTTGDAAKNDKPPPRRSFGQPRPGSLPTIVRAYKSAVTRRCRRAHRPDFAWQRNYYEHIVRPRRRDLQRIRRYIAQNPLRWHHDSLFSDVSP